MSEREPIEPEQVARLRGELHALFAANRFQEAESAGREILRHAHRDPIGWKAVALALAGQGRPADALPALQTAASLLPNDPDVHKHLGDALRAAERVPEAVAAYRRALALQPAFPEALCNLGNALLALDRPMEAEQAYRRAAELKPDFPQAWSNLGNALTMLGRYAEAEAACRNALALAPDLHYAHGNLGNVLRLLGRFAESEACSRRALALLPGHANEYNNLGSTLLYQERLPEAAESYRKALELNPRMHDAHNNLASALFSLGRISEARASYQQALDLRPDFHQGHSNLLFCLAHDESVGAEELFARHQAFGRHLEAPLKPYWPAHANPRDPERPLRVGFVSGDLYNHAVANFLEPVLARLARDPAFTLVAYSSTTTDDAVTRHLRELFAAWRPIVGMPDADAARLVQSDAIDILVDLSGHTGRNRLPVFARKPAPVQASWIGYPGTTGLEAMDYYIADRLFLPQEEFGGQFTEKLAHLPATVSFRPRDDAPELAPLPALASGAITFGSFNRQNKITPSVIRTWSALMRAAPGSRLLLGGLFQDGDHAALAARFAAEGIAQERLVFRARCRMEDYLSLHHQVDLCLDTFSYTGGTTTLHALWMGVPTLTLAGGTPPRRQGAAILAHMDLPGFIARDTDDFLAKGVHWAGQLPELAAIRAELRTRFRRSAMGQPDAVAASFARALRHMWRRWCAGLPAESFDAAQVLERAQRGGDGTLAALRTLLAEGRYAEAASHARGLVQARPELELAWQALALALGGLGRYADLVPVLQEMARRWPANAETLANLGYALRETNRVAEAIEAYSAATRLAPANAGALGELGKLLWSARRLTEAEACMRRLVELDPRSFLGHTGLGHALRDQGRLAEATKSYRQALALDPAIGDAHAHLGSTLHVMGELPEAEALYRKALELSPGNAAAWSNLAELLHQQGRMPEAELACRRALSLKPGFADAHVNLSNTLSALGRFAEAEDHCRHAIELSPGLASAHANLGNALLGIGNLPAAAASYRRALELNPTGNLVHSNLLFCLSQDAAVGADQLFAEHRAFGRRLEASVGPAVIAHGNSRDPDRRLRVGFVSADLREHSVAYFIEPILSRLAAQPGLSLHAFSSSNIRDDVTLRLQGLFERWHDAAALPDEALADAVRAEGIDILFDLSGHTFRNRLPVFARRPAPVQASWIGYPGTTGLEAMDYYLADRHFLPLEPFARQFSEKLVHLPAVVAFSPYAKAPAVNALPALKNGHITFGSFNRQSKIGAEAVAAWSALLREVPDSRLLLGGLSVDGQHEDLVERFAREGLAPERISTRGRCGMDEYLALHRQVDLCLDTFAYTGGTTTLHALWMGVPTLTIAGETPPRRQGAAVLGHLKLQDFIARDTADFLDKGRYWATHPEELAAIRKGLRRRFGRSSIGKPDLVASGLAQALRQMWHRWCAGWPPEAFEVKA